MQVGDLRGHRPNMYQLWLGGHPAQAERTAFESHISKMKLADLEKTLEPIFEMYKTQRTSKDEAFGDFCFRVGKDGIKEYMEKPKEVATVSQAAQLQRIFNETDAPVPR